MKSNQLLFSQASFPENSSILVFIDSQVQNYQDLKNGIKAGTEVYILHPEVNGVEQITQTLSQHQYVESIHIISHGTPGTLFLGNAELSLKTLGHYTQEIQTWFNSTPDYYTPALLLYGCNVAADGGTEFLEKLHNISQTTIYASSTAVGNSNLGGNWDLDVRYGKDISHFPGLIFQPEVLVTYAGVFGTGSDKYYTYYDSKEGTKGTVAFTDISSTGIFQTVARDQQTSITLPFEFNFYGNNFSQIVIGENGGISFSGTAQFRNNAIIPSTSSGVPLNSIFPFWDDLDAQITATDRTGKIYTKSESNRFIVQWTNFKAENSNINNNYNYITFQVVLYKDSNNIDFIYSTATPNDGSTASIGLNKGTSEDSKPVGVAYSVNTSTLNGVSSIRFLTEPQLKVNTLAVKEGETITLSSSNFNATDVDNSIDLSKITYNISNLQNGEFRLNGIIKTTFTQQDINSGVVQFVHNGSENAPSFNINLSDGYNTSSQKTPTISFTNINNNPELKDTISSVVFNENALNIATSIINSNITLTDVDSSDFNAGNLTVNYSSGSGAEDQLSVNSGNGITLSSGNVSYNGAVFGSVDTTNNGAGGKSLVIKFTNLSATLAAVKALIQNLTYQNISNTPSPSRTISITVNDGDGGTSTAVSKVINVTAENDAPVNTVPGTQTINEDEILTFTSASLISISDPDAGNNLIKVRLETNKGTLSLNGISGLDFTGGAGDGTDDATLEFKGIITDINKALNGMNFKPTANSNGAASVRVLTDDLGNSGAGTNLTSDKTITININAINDSPINTVPAAQSVKEEKTLVFNSANNNLIRVDDVDVNENVTGVLRVTLSVTKGILTLASINGINFDSGNSNGQANITFTGKLADVNNALNGLTYLGNTNLNGTDTLKIITDDLGNVGIGGSKKDEKLISINIDAVNDAPINTVPGAQSVEEDKDLIFSMANGKAITVSDVDVNEGTGELEVTLSVTNGALILADTTGISFLSGSSNGKSSIFFKGTLSAINKALDGLTYRGNLNYNGTDILSIVTSDLGNKGEGGILQDASKTVQINITAVNDAPVNTFPGQQSIEEDKNLVFKSSTSNAISVSDVDLAKDKGDIQVILSVIKGKLTLGQQTPGLTLLQGNESNSITLKGTQTDINSALEGLTYRGNQDFNGDDTLKILTSDLGNTGIPGELKKEDTVQIKITAINDAPEIAVPVSQVINEDTDLELTGINAIQVKDVDAAEGSGEVQVKLSVAKGTLNLKVITGLTFDATSGNGKSDVIFRGKIADVNIALKSLVYRGNLNVNGDDTLTVTASDLGNTGIGGILTDIKRVQITINPVNDSPINTVPIQQIVDEDVQLIFNTANGNAISITDVDALEGTGKVEVKLSVTKGLLTLSNTSDLTFTEGDGVSDSNLTFTGSVDKINQALNGLVYLGNQDSNSNAKGDDTLTIITSDLGNTGSGDIKTDTDTVTIKRNAINDAPVNTVPGNQSVDEDTDLALTGAKAIQIKDVDAAEGTGVVEVKLSVGKGILTLQDPAKLTFNSNNANGKSTVVFRGQVADINAALNTLVYRGNLNANGVDTLTVTTNDLGNTGRGGALTDIDSFQITIDPVNDAPAIAVPAEQNVNEDFTLVFNDFNKNAIIISDVDVKEGTGILEVTLSVTHGLLTLNGTTGLEFTNGDGLGNATMTFRGSIDRVNQVLNGLTYLGNEDLNSDVQGEDNLTISISDFGNRGKGNILKDEEIVKIQLTAINDAPINTVPGEQTVKEDTDLTFSTTNKNAITVSDIDVNEGTGDLKVTVGVTKGALTLKQITGLTFLQGDGTIDTSMTFKGKVTDINSALEGLVYRGNQDFNGEDTLTINTDDLGNFGLGGPLTKQDTVKIKVSAVNDAPINTVPDTQTVNEDEDLIFSDTKNNLISITDVDANEGTGEVEVTLAVNKGILTLKDTAGLTFAANNTNGKPLMTFKGKVADINKALDGLVYRGNKNYNGNDTLTITTNDLNNTDSGSSLQDIDTVQITLTPVNDPPVNAEVPGTQNVNEDTSLIFNTANQNAIRISDVDVDADQNSPVGDVQVTLAVGKGKVTLAQTTGLTFAQGSSNGSATVIITGSVENINKALDGLAYLGNQDSNGEDTLTISINDKSNGGSGGELYQTDTIKINVKAVNDTPINIVPSKQSVKEDTVLAFNAGNGNSVSISDVDANEGTGETEVKLFVTKGMLTLQETAGLTFKEGDGKGNTAISFTGKLTDINKALASLTYRGNANFNGQDTLTITTNDNSNSSESSVLTDSDTVDITITPVNDAPINNIPQNQKVDENKKLIFSAQKGNAISISDIDVNEGTGEVEVTLAVSKGVLTLEQVTGITFKAGDGKANATMTFIGKVADINKALEGIVYRGNNNYSGQDSLTITTSDLGNFGTGILIDTDIISISVIPDTDNDGVSNSAEEEVALEIAKQNPTDSNFKSLSQKAASDPGVVALFGQDGTKKPIVIAINEQDQKQLGGTSQTPALVINLTTQRFNDAVPDSITAFDSKDLKKSSLTKLVSALDVINFGVMPNPVISEDTLQPKIKEGIKQKAVRVEIKLPDGPDDLPVNTILIRKSDGILYDFRRLFNPNRGESDDDALTGAVLQDRNLDGKADWAVVYLQDGKWGDEDDLVNAKIANSLVAANWDLGSSRMKVRPSQDGLNFYGNRSYVQFTLDRFSGVEASEVGMARVRFDSDGQIIEVNGKSVKSTDEAKQTIIQRGETLFSSLSNKNRNPDIGIQTHTVAFEEGEQAVFFVIQNGTKDELLFKGLNSNSVQFSLPTLNNGGAMMTASNDKFEQTAKLSLAGLFNLSAKFLTAEEARSQLGLLAISQSQAQSNTTDELIDLKSSAAFDGKQVKLNLSLQREAANNNSAYLYRVDDAKGSIRDSLTGMLLDPTSGLSVEQKQRYLELITTDRLVQGTEIQASNLQTQEISVNLTGGEYYLPFLVSDGTLLSINKDFSRILTSHLGINSDGVDHIRSLGNNKFGFEDLVGGGDRDYNDMIFSIRQVQIIG